MEPKQVHKIFPLDTLLLNLEREGITFGVDTHLRLQTVLQQLGKEYLHQPQKLGQILCPILVQSEEDTLKFHQIFDEYLKKTVQPSIDAHIRGENTHQKTVSPIRIDPDVRKHTSFRSRILPSLLAAILGGIALTLLFIQNKEDTLEFQPVFEIYNSENELIGIDDSIYVGDEIRFRNRSYEFLEKSFDRSLSNAEIKDLDFHWDMGDNSPVKESVRTHSFAKEGRFQISLNLENKNTSGSMDRLPSKTGFVRSVRVFCKEKLQAATFSINPERPIVGQKVLFNMQIKGDTSAYKIIWEVDGAPIDHQNYRFKQAGKFRLSAKVQPISGSQNVCDMLTKVMDVQVVPNEKNTILTPVGMEKDPGGESQYGFTYLATLLPTLLLFALVFLIDRLRLNKRKKSLLENTDLDLTVNKEGPYEIPYPDMNYLLSPGSGLYSLSKILRQRRMGERNKLDILSTAKATARALGMLDLKYLSTSKASEYLILIEQNHPQSHTARLFERLADMLKGEDVVLELFYFDTDIRICWNDDFPDGISLTRLRQRFARHRLLLYSDGHHMVDPYEAKLKDWVGETLAVWKNRAALITPIPSTDWGYRERLLFPYFYPLDADLQSQREVTNLFTDNIIISFEGLKEANLSSTTGNNYSLLDFDFEDKNDLKLYLGDSLFQWLAATMVYPLPTWEMTLAVGRKLSSDSADSHLLSYDNLLQLARIPWMQTGLLSPRLRKELLETLSPEAEHLAREAVLEVLDQVELRGNSLAAKKHAIQSISNKFLTTPGDEEIARKMYVLWQNNELNDSSIERKLDSSLAELDGDKASQYLRTRFEQITPMRTLVKAMWMAVMVAVATFFLHDTLDQQATLKEYSLRFKLDKLGLIKSVDLLDSAAYFNDLGVEAFEEGDLLSARIHFYKALQHRHYQKLKQAGTQISYEEEVNQPYWDVSIRINEETEFKRREFSIMMDERLHDLQSLPSAEEFDFALLNSFTEKMIRINGEGIDSIRFKDYPRFDQIPGTLAPYLFVKDYPIAGRNLLSLVMYNEGVEAFNKQQYKIAAGHFSRDAHLLSGELVEVNKNLLQRLHLDVLHGAGLSYYYDGNEGEARKYLSMILEREEAFFEMIEEPKPHLEELLDRRDIQAKTEKKEKEKEVKEAIDLELTNETFLKYVIRKEKEFGVGEDVNFILEKNNILLRDLKGMKLNIEAGLYNKNSLSNKIQGKEELNLMDQIQSSGGEALFVQIEPVDIVGIDNINSEILPRNEDGRISYTLEIEFNDPQRNKTAALFFTDEKGNSEWIVPNSSFNVSDIRRVFEFLIPRPEKIPIIRGEQAPGIKGKQLIRLITWTLTEIKQKEDETTVIDSIIERLINEHGK